MYNTLSDIFEESMQRERHIAFAFSSDEPFDCFFRRNNDNMNMRDSMVMYYRVDAPIRAGSLIKLHGHTYLALNRETIENNVYYKSALVRTNGIINTHSISVIGLPFYSDNSVNNATSSNGANISIIDGNVEVLTEDNEVSRGLSVNDLFNEWGRTWRISNLFYIDGICHIVIEVNADVNPTFDYRVELSPLQNVHVIPGDADAIKATCYINDKQVAGKVTYGSSNEAAATIDADGNISYIADGHVSFTATWIEQDVSATTDVVTVKTEQESEKVTVYMDTITEVFDGFETDFSAYALRGGVRDDTIPVKVKAENVSGIDNQAYALKFIKVTDMGGGKYQVLTDNSTLLLGKTFDLVASVAEYGAEARQTVKVESFF